MSFEDAETFKKDPKNQQTVRSLVHPVMQKVGDIVRRHIAAHNVETLYLVGGTSGMLGMAEVVTDMTGIPAVVPPHPLFVTPVGIAMHDRS